MKKPHWRQFKDSLRENKNDVLPERYFNYVTRSEYEEIKAVTGPSSPSMLRVLLSATHSEMLRHVNLFIDEQIKLGAPEVMIDRIRSDHQSMMMQAHYVGLWESCGRRILRPQKDLFQIMKDTDASVPISIVKAPFTSVYIDFPVPMRCEKTKQEYNGAYVSLGPNEFPLIKDQGDPRTSRPAAKDYLYENKHRMKDLCLSMTMVADDKDMRLNTFHSEVHWDIGDTDSVEDLIDEHRKIYGGKAVMAMDEQIIRMSINLFLFMSSPSNDTVAFPGKLRSKIKSSGRKKRKNLLDRIEQTMETHDHILGGTIRLPSEYYSDTDGTSTGRKVRPHLRRNHYRAQWVGKMNSPERRQEPRLILWMIINGASLSPEDAAPTEYIVG